MHILQNKNFSKIYILLYHFTHHKKVQSAGFMSQSCCAEKHEMEVMEEKVDEEQGGFRKGRGCVHQIFAMKILMEKYIGKK